MTTVEEVKKAARKLNPVDQLQLIQELLRDLQLNYHQPSQNIPAGVRRAAPMSDLGEFTANFWPEDETADDINNFVAQQRAADRASYLRTAPHLQGQELAISDFRGLP